MVIVVIIPESDSRSGAVVAGGVKRAGAAGQTRRGNTGCDSRERFYFLDRLVARDDLLAAIRAEPL